ncbi:MAG: PEGA domain-containing protein [bacterium]
MLAQPTPVRIAEIAPGNHKLTLILPQFDPIVKSINIPRQGTLFLSGENHSVGNRAYVLHFKTRLDLSSRPPDAEIIINGVKLKQRTPATVYWEVDDKPINIQMQIPNMPPLRGLQLNTVTGKETIEDRRFWRFRRVDPVKDQFAIEGIFYKNVTINSIPTRANIYLDDGYNAVGITGLSGNLLLAPGTHTITLIKERYIPRKFRITIDANTPDTISKTLRHTVRILARDASSDDRSDIGAFLVEMRTGNRATTYHQKTPVEMQLLPYQYTAVLKKKGFRDRQIQISPSDNQIIVRMIPLSTRVSITALDAITSVPINAAQIRYKNDQDMSQGEKVLGNTDQQGSLIGQLTPGFFQFTIDKPGYAVETKSYRIRHDQENRLTFWLKPNR